MSPGQQPRRRKSRRLRGYDYSLTGAYFITLCTQDRRELFGDVQVGEMRANEAGRMALRWWDRLPTKFPYVVVDERGIMPNHFHGILLFWPDESEESEAGQERPGANRPGLPEVLQWLKTMTTNEYIRRVGSEGWPPFTKRLWQRDYHDHIARGEEGLDDYRRYIRDNPARWAMDKENPVARIIDPRWGGGRRGPRR